MVGRQGDTVNRRQGRGRSTATVIRQMTTLLTNR